MPEKRIDEIPPAWRNRYLKGVAASKQGDWDTAINTFNAVLETEPGLLACRKALHAAQVKRAETGSGFLKRLAEELQEGPLLAEAELCLHSHPLKAITTAEQVLNHHPFSVLAHKVLAKAALTAQLPRTALLSLEFVLKHAAENDGVVLELAEALAEAGRSSEAATLCGRLLKQKPHDKRVSRILGHLAKFARQQTHIVETPPSGNSAPAATSSKAKKAVNAPRAPGSGEEETDQGLIYKYEAFLRHGPNNHLILKKLGDLYARKSDLDHALEYYWRALQVAGGKDAETEKAIESIGRLKSTRDPASP